MQPRTPTDAEKNLMLHVINITSIVIACQEFHHLHLMDPNQGVWCLANHHDIPILCIGFFYLHDNRVEHEVNIVEHEESW